eukprot:TRINITY_DN4228_c0_g1_i1.p1 TRINITY_DN4228_c0_g1~~TRINITY_DN4228_c0_g1_i1.p1  ORF type:complete len:187 (-),score=44.47 TRINITY_DN4228_c0_g1_i1:93-653(-)
MTEPRLKVVLLGDYGVGKTSIIHRFADKVWNPDISYTTTQIKECVVAVETRVVPIQLWDTAGSERFSTLTVSYYKNVDVAVLVYDVSNEDSFDHIENWQKELKQFTQHDIYTIIIGNKIDLERKVSLEEAQDYAEKCGCKWLEVSAKEGENIEPLFVSLVKDYYMLQTESKGKSRDSPKKAGCVLL